MSLRLPTFVVFLMLSTGCRNKPVFVDVPIGLVVKPSQIDRDYKRNVKQANVKYVGKTLCIDGEVDSDSFNAPCANLIDVGKGGQRLPGTFITVCAGEGTLGYYGAWTQVHLICETPAKYEMSSPVVTVHGCRDNYSQTMPCPKNRSNIDAGSIRTQI